MIANEPMKFKVKDSDTVYTLSVGLFNQYEITWTNSSGEFRDDLKDKSWVDQQFEKGEWYYIGQEKEVKPQSALNKQVSGNHYKDCGIQPIEYIHANGLSYLEGNVIKYTTRHSKKNGKADIEKAIHYLELILEMEYKGETE